MQHKTISLQHENKKTLRPARYTGFNWKHTACYLNGREILISVESTENRTLVIAHAGCEHTVPGSAENLRRAAACGADVIEMDLQFFEGEVYLAHDPVSAANRGELLTLDQAFDLLQDTPVRFNCDLKTAETMPEVVRIADAHGLLDRVIFTGEYTPKAQPDTAGYHHFRNTEHLGIVAPHEPITQDKALRLIDAFQNAADRTLEAYNIEYTTLTEEAAALFARAGVPVCCWTVDDPERLQRLIRQGIYAVTTNLLQKAYEVRGN